MGNRVVRRPIDLSLLVIMMALVTIGIIMILSTSSVVGFSNFNDSYYFIKKHVIFLVLGLIAFLAGVAFPHQRYKQLALPGFLIGIFLLVLTLIPGVGVKIGGAQRWLNLGFMSVQPVEVMKFFIIVFVSLGLANKKYRMTSFTQGVIPVMGLAIFPVGLLILQPDLGNSILLMMTVMTMLFLSPMRLVHFGALIGAGLVALTGIILTHPYQMARIKGFISPWADPLGRNYHIIQSFIAIGSGGIFGLGLGESKLKYYYLPLHYSDFIFSIVCEEGGFILASIVILLYAALFLRGISIAQRVGDPFAFYLATGLTLLLIFQALINMGVVTGVLPVTGIPLTFLSFGGTSLVTSMFFVGVLLNISRYTFVAEEDEL